MSDQGELYEMSWILYHVLDRFIGSQEIVAIRRKMPVVMDHVLVHTHGVNLNRFFTGSKAEGMDFPSSDFDFMLIDKSVIVMCPYKDISNQIDTANKSVLMMREASSRPGYVNLEILHIEKLKLNSLTLRQSTVVVSDSHFLSSELYKWHLSSLFPSRNMSHGPALTTKYNHKNGTVESDNVFSFPCYNWPSEANEWVDRPRLHNWPDKSLRDQIVHEGCHLVPVGDKTSANPSLQWRLSFVTAERKLIYSLSHVQFLVYGLLKYLLKQISEILEQISGEDVLSSYIIKTAVFHAVENTPGSFWQKKNTFLCFRFCLKILVNWVKTGYCPNYFIKKNNMFLGKVHGQNRQKLVRYLTDLYDMNLRCLSVGKAIQPTIGERIRDVRRGAWEYVLPQPAYLECERDEAILNLIFFLTRFTVNLSNSLRVLLTSKSDIDELLGYVALVQVLSTKGMRLFGKHVTARGNKEKYKSLRKSKNLMRMAETVDIGLLRMATYFYQTGNYRKALELCDQMLSSSKIYLSDWNTSYKYAQLYCGRGYSILRKYQAIVTDILITKSTLQFYPSQLPLQEIEMRLDLIPRHLLQFTSPAFHQYMQNMTEMLSFPVPPHPYAVFLSFLCHHELGNTRRRDRALIRLQAVKYDEEQGVNHHWIVHNILGKCFEIVGDRSSAFREYRDYASRQRRPNQDTMLDMVEHLKQAFQQPLHFY